MNEDSENTVFFDMLPGIFNREKYTREDAQMTGLDQLVPIIDNGNDALGTVLEQCGSEFMKTFDQSDTIIAKGLANYETLIEYDSGQLPQMVCYLFRAKCPFIAQSDNAAINDLVVRVKG